MEIIKKQNSDQVPVRTVNESPVIPMQNKKSSLPTTESPSLLLRFSRLSQNGMTFGLMK